MCQFDNTPHLYWIDLETLLKAKSPAPALCTILFWMKHNQIYVRFGINNLSLASRVMCKLTLSSPCLWPAFSPHPLFQWYLQSKKILLNLSLKCRNSAFNAQGSRIIIVVVQVGAVKIYAAAAVQAVRKKEREHETQFTTQVGGKTSLGPSYFAL